MCSINHDLKAIYIHVPKCGGSFIGTILRHYYDFESIRLPHEKHKDFNSLFDNNNYNYEDDDDLNKCDCRFCNSYGDAFTTTEQGILRYYSSSKLYNLILEMNEYKWKNYKKFTIIRNPYDKFISAWKFIYRKKNVTESNLDEYINKSKSELYDFDKFAYSHSHITSCDHLLDVNNELNIDYIGSFENLNEDLCDILLKIGVDKIKHRKELEENIKYNANEHATYIEYYDDSIIEKVNKILQKDFDTFKQYKQLYTLEEMKEDSNKYLISQDDFNEKNKNLVKRLEKYDLIVEK